MDHSVSMAQKLVGFGHGGFDVRKDNIINNLPAVAVAENVAFGQTTAQQVVQAWINSPGHRQNIEGDYDCTGLSVQYDADNRPYYTSMFAKRAD